MMKRTPSAIASLIVCILLSAVLAVWLFTFPELFDRVYTAYQGAAADPAAVARVVRAVVTCFYLCAPFAAAALAMLIKLLLNIIKEKLFIRQNVCFLRWLSWCCYAVFAASAVMGLRYLPLCAVAMAMGVVGTLLRVVKNLIQTAVELREENDLTI